MMILSILATVVLLGALFYHRVVGVGTGASGHYPRAI